MGVVDDYLRTVAAPQHDILGAIKTTVEKTIPDAKQVITYGMPGYKYKGKYLISFAAFKDHMSIFPGSEAVDVFKDKLAGFKLSKGTVQFTIDKPLPDSLLVDILLQCKARIDG